MFPRREALTDDVLGRAPTVRCTFSKHCRSGKSDATIEVLPAIICPCAVRCDPLHYPSTSDRHGEITSLCTLAVKLGLACTIAACCLSKVPSPGDPRRGARVARSIGSPRKGYQVKGAGDEEERREFSSHSYELLEIVIPGLCGAEAGAGAIDHHCERSAKVTI